MKNQPLAKMLGGMCIALLVLWLVRDAALTAKSLPPGRSQSIQTSRNEDINVNQTPTNGGYNIYYPAVLNYYSLVPLRDWSSSGHADATSQSFTHWDDAIPPEIPTSCAKCHSTTGFLDFLGEDGTPPGTVDNPAPTGTVIECKACHNDTAESMTVVSFASGSTVSGLGREAACIQCHQARNSTKSVDEMVDGYGHDEKPGTTGFLNPHYLTAADTFLGGEAKGAYQYPGKTYLSRYLHVEELNTCITCHQEHSLDVAAARCSECHSEVTGPDDFVKIRTSSGDFDGDGDDREGIAEEIITIHESLYDGIKEYAKDTNGFPIVYSAGTYPYFFFDTNGNGEPDKDEIEYDNR